MKPDFVVVVNVILPICCHIGLCIQCLPFYVEAIVMLLSAMID